MRVAEVPLDAIDAGLIGRWADLSSRAVEPNPFFEPDFVLPAFRHLRDDRHIPALLIADNSDRLDACIPIVRTDGWRRLPRVTLGTWMHDYCFVGTPLVDPENPSGTVRDLVHGAVTGPFLALDWVTTPPGSALDSALRGADSPCVVYEQFTRAALEPRADGPSALPISSQRRHRLRRLARRLGDDVGGDVRVTNETDGPTIERFLELERSGWKGRAGTAMACRSGHHEFFREVCSRFDATGRLRVDTLMAGDRAAAMVCSLLAGHRRFLFKAAFDERLARFSPGTQVLVASCDGATVPIDSCAAPTEHWLDDLLPHRRTVRTLLFPPSGRFDGVAAGALRSAVWLRDHVRKAP